MASNWDKFGRDILNIVEDAISSHNFKQLNKTITDAVNDTVTEVRDGLRGAEQSVSRQINKQVERWSAGRPSPQLFRKNTGWNIGGWALTVCGCTMNVGFGIAVIVLCLVSLFMGGFPMGIRITLSILLPFLAGSAVMTGAGSSMRASIRRYRTYIEGLKGRTYCNIRELAEYSGKSVPYVIKDIRKMIKKGWFIQGHLDQENTCLMVSHETYREYEELRRQRMEQQIAEERKNQEESKQMDETVQGESLRVVMEKGKEYIHRIRACGNAISGKEISGKISRMETLIRKIFDRVGTEPGCLEDIDKMMEYYLPTTVKLLEAYQSLDEQPVQGENIHSSKIEIEQTLDTLNQAFERLLDSLFEDVAWDVSSDISVLHTMLAQEGLTGNDDWKGDRR